MKRTTKKFLSKVLSSFTAAMMAVTTFGGALTVPLSSYAAESVSVQVEAYDENRNQVNSIEGVGGGNTWDESYRTYLYVVGWVTDKKDTKKDKTILGWRLDWLAEEGTPTQAKLPAQGTWAQFIM